MTAAVHDNDQILMATRMQEGDNRNVVGVRCVDNIKVGLKENYSQRRPDFS